MRTPLITLHQLRSEMTRFSTVSLGQDKVDTMRNEFSALLAVVADVTGLPQAMICTEDLRDYQHRLAQRAALKREDLLQGAYAAIEALTSGIVTEGMTREGRQSLAADAAIWILAVGRNG
jgi:hypothetical protein